MQFNIITVIGNVCIKYSICFQFPKKIHISYQDQSLGSLPFEFLNDI